MTRRALLVLAATPLLLLMGCTLGPLQETTEAPDVPLIERLPSAEELAGIGWTQTDRHADASVPRWTPEEASVCEGYFGVLFDDGTPRRYATTTFERDGVVLMLEAIDSVDAHVMGRIQRALATCDGHTSRLVRDGVIISVTATLIESSSNGSSGGEFIAVEEKNEADVRRVVFANDGYLVDTREGTGDETTELLIVTTTGRDVTDIDLETRLIERFRGSQPSKL